MIVLNRRSKVGFFRLKDVYYAPDVQNEVGDCDAVYYYYCQQPVGRAKVFTTMLVDLQPSPEEILYSFHKKTRQAIQAVIHHKWAQFIILSNPQAEELDYFVAAYNRFAHSKGIAACDQVLLNQLFLKGYLLLASGLIEGEITNQNALINAPNRLVAYYGYNTRFAINGQAGRGQQISKVNRALDYHCMIYARGLGKRFYDFCGLTLNPDDPGSSNVDHYKLGFRGVSRQEYHFAYPLTPRGRMLCQAKALFGGVG